MHLSEAPKQLGGRGSWATILLWGVHRATLTLQLYRNGHVAFFRGGGAQVPLTNAIKVSKRKTEKYRLFFVALFMSLVIAITSM